MLFPQAEIMKSMKDATEYEIEDFEKQGMELEDSMLNSLPNKYKPLVEVSQVSGTGRHCKSSNFVDSHTYKPVYRSLCVYMALMCIRGSQHLLNVMDDQKKKYVEPLQEYTDMMAEEKVVLLKIQKKMFPGGSFKKFRKDAMSEFEPLQASVTRMLALVGKHQKLSKRLVKGGKWINRTANVLKYAQTPTAQNIFRAMDMMDEFIGKVAGVLNDPTLPPKLEMVEAGFTTITTTLKVLTSGTEGSTGSNARKQKGSERKLA